jgi:hypothetical protein
MRPIGRIKDEAEKKRAREEAASGYLQEWGAQMEKQIEGPFVAGSAIHVVDLKIFVLLGAYLDGKIDHVPANVFQAFPRLVGVHAAVRQHPGVVSWYSR